MLDKGTQTNIALGSWYFAGNQVETIVLCYGEFLLF